MSATEYNKTMEKYLRVLRFTFGLALVIAVGSLNALFMTPKSEWFSSLSGMAVSGKLHSVIWLAIYILTAIHIGEAIGSGPLKKSRLYLAGFITLGSAWCFVFFRLHNMIGGVCLLSVCALCAGVVFIQAARYTKITVYLSVPLFAWYLYLLFVNAYLVACN